MDITTSNVGIAKDIIMSIAACFTAGVAYSHYGNFSIGKGSAW